MASPSPAVNFPHNSDQAVKILLTDRLNAVEKELGEDVITYRGPISYGVDDLIRDSVEGIQQKQSRIGMLLQTNGGYVTVAERIAGLLRHHYSHVEFIVPNYALSAGTI